MKSSSELYENFRLLSRKKALKSKEALVSLSILAGLYIGLGAVGSITASSCIEGGLGKLIGASIFPVGLVMVLIAGAELFTGNNLMTIGLLNKDINTVQLLRNWIYVYIGNLIGSLLLASLIYQANILTGNFGQTAMAIATKKVGLIHSLGLQGLLIKAVLCNILVVIAVWLASSAATVLGKILACWFPVMLFVFSGFEHSIANMFFLYLGKFAGATLTNSDIWLQNILPVTLGNILGGAIIIPGLYHMANK